MHKDGAKAKIAPEVLIYERMSVLKITKRIRIRCGCVCNVTVQNKGKCERYLSLNLITQKLCYEHRSIHLLYRHQEQEQEPSEHNEHKNWNSLSTKMKNEQCTKPNGIPKTNTHTYTYALLVGNVKMKWTRKKNEENHKTWIICEKFFKPMLFGWSSSCSGKYSTSRILDPFHHQITVCISSFSFLVQVIMPQR